MRNLRTRLRRRGNPIEAHDALPPALRLWLHQAALPWSARSALKLWQRAMAETGDAQAARARLARAEARLLARDAARVWGKDYPLSRPH